MKKKHRLTFTLLTHEDVVAIDDDALAGCFVLFDEPWFLHRGHPRGSLAVILDQMRDRSSFFLKLRRRGIHLFTLNASTSSPWTIDHRPPLQVQGKP